MDPLVIPPVMPPTGNIVVKGGKNANYYEIAVRQFQQQILPRSNALGNPTGFGLTTVWSYGSINHPNTFNYPAFTIEAEVNKPVRVKWINGLVDSENRFLLHLLPVDQTVHWANPPGGIDGSDQRGTDQAPYDGPVPIVTHVHGAHTADDSDGFAEAWFLPDAKNIPQGFATTGTRYDFFKQQFLERWGVSWQKGTATFQYPNDQRAATIWYHDHVLGMTRLNVYAGPAGFYLLRGGSSDLYGGVLPGPAPELGDPPGKRYYEIPIAIQDRSFKPNSELFYPDDRAFFESLQPDQLQIPFIPDTACDNQPSDVSPIWNPEFFGTTMVVNGKTWPNLNVEPRRYRFRFLNGCNSRFVILRIAGDPTTRPATSALPFWQIGNEGGFLPKPVQLDTLLMSPAERADVIVDFSSLSVGTELYLINEGLDAPFGGLPIAPEDLANPNTTGQVMKFTVVRLESKDTSIPPNRLHLPKFKPLGAESLVRQVSLGELDSATVRVSEQDGNIVLDCENGVPFGPTESRLGTVSFINGVPVPTFLKWNDDITENPSLNATEVWEIYNFTVDAHPIHLHEVQFEVVNRQTFSATTGNVGPIINSEPWETGTKDTVIAYPGQITRIKAMFDIPGLFVWHCHIVEHEDNEMMRPYAVGPIPQLSPSKPD